MKETPADAAAEAVASLLGNRRITGRWVSSSFPLQTRPKNLPSAVLAFFDSDTLVVQVLAKEEVAALKSQFRRTSVAKTEEETLRKGGVAAADLAAGAALWAVTRRRSEKAYQAILGRSLTVEKAAKELGVSGGRVRQLLKERRLYGLKLAGKWRMPAFQFLGRERGLVPGIEEVLRRLPHDLGALTVHGWFTTPNADLCSREEEEPTTPLDWLRQGHSPGEAAALAAEL